MLRFLKALQAILKSTEVFGTVIVNDKSTLFYYQNCGILSNFETQKDMGPIKFTVIKKLKSNNRFNYTPRYYKGKEVDEKEFRTRLDAYNETINNNDFGGNWREARLSSRNRNNRDFNKTIIVIVLVLVLLFLWLIDFDLSIFS